MINLRQISERNNTFEIEKRIKNVPPPAPNHPKLTDPKRLVKELIDPKRLLKKVGEKN